MKYLRSFAVVLLAAFMAGCGSAQMEAQEHAHEWEAVTETVFHEEMGHYETLETGEAQWVVDTEAWTESVTTGYVCSICGATK